MARQREYTNDRGNQVIASFCPDRERYHYDFKTCTMADGWQQWDTVQDASYFGVWVHPILRSVVTFAEGDEFITSCATAEAFSAEIAALEAFHTACPNPDRLTAKQALEGAQSEPADLYVVTYPDGKGFV